MALPKYARLLPSSEIRQVLDDGRSRAGRSAVVYWRFRSSGNNPRIAFIVSRRIGPAVTRNRVRRRFSALFQQRLNLIRDDVDLVVIARRPAVGMKFAEIGQDIELTLRRSNLLKR